MKTRSQKSFDNEKKALGGGMTKWWLTTTFITFVLSYVLEYIPHFNRLHNVMEFMRGLCAVSALCVCIGYYAFTFAFNATQRESLASQIHCNMNLSKSMSLFTYHILDTFVHIFLCLGIFYIWFDTITPSNAIGAFMFHRLWSLITSKFNTIYFMHADRIYGFKKNAMPWIYYMMYIIESLICVGLVSYTR